MDGAEDDTWPTSPPSTIMGEPGSATTPSSSLKAAHEALNAVVGVQARDHFLADVAALVEVDVGLEVRLQGVAVFNSSRRDRRRRPARF